MSQIKLKKAIHSDEAQVRVNEAREVLKCLTPSELQAVIASTVLGAESHGTAMEIAARAVGGLLSGFIIDLHLKVTNSELTEEAVREAQVDFFKDMLSIFEGLGDKFVGVKMPLQLYAPQELPDSLVSAAYMDALGILKEREARKKAEYTAKRVLHA